MHIRLSNSTDDNTELECNYIESEGSQNVFTKECHSPTLGRFLKLIRNPTAQSARQIRLLALCEVVVMGYVYPTGKYDNIKKYKCVVLYCNANIWDMRISNKLLGCVIYSHMSSILT